MSDPSPEQERGPRRVYGNEAIEVQWEPKLCIHVRNCVRGLPQVFDPDARPWVIVDAASADQVAGAVLTCPTGALHFRRLDDGPQEAAAEPPTVEPRPNGPLFVRGHVRIVDPDGRLIRQGHPRRALPLRRIREQAVLRRKPSPDRLSGLTKLTAYV